MELPCNRKILFPVYLLLMAMIFVGFSAQSHAQTQQKSEAQECRKDADCVVIANGCVTSAVNERYEYRAQDWAKKMDREFDTCGGKSTLDPIAYCRYDVVDCKKSNSRKVGTYCISERGQCSLIY